MSKFEQRSKNSYDKKAKNYEETFDGRFTFKLNQQIIELLTVHAKDTVVDIACGNGRLLRMLNEKYAFKGYGVDISEEMIIRARRVNPDMTFFVGECESLPFQGGDIDVMTVCAAFHHFPNVKAFAKEAGRVLKSGGTLCIGECYLPGVLRILCNPFVRFSRAGDVRFYSPGEISALFVRHGFVIKNVIIEGNRQIILMQKTL